jgi:hypothetical protein
MFLLANKILDFVNLLYDLSEIRMFQLLQFLSHNAIE